MFLKKLLSINTSRNNKKKILKLTLILTLFLFLSVNYQFLIVSGDSMSPSFQEGDIVLIDKYLYSFFPLQRNDLVIFKNLDNWSLKRIKYLPDEKIPPLSNPYEEKYYEYKLRQDEFYVLGDNPNQSHDSRHLGPIKKQELVGKVVISF